MHNGEGPRATRREILAAVSASALALSTGVGFAKSRAVATGRVFHDRSGTSRRSRGDPGIPEVMVSNGRNVVVTDSEGRWRLPIADGDGVFVIKPSGWTTPYGLGGVPRSFSLGGRMHGDGRDRLSSASPRREQLFRSATHGRHATRERRRTRLPARRHHRGSNRQRCRLRHQPRRYRIRRSFSLPALPADPGCLGHPLASLPGEPRHQFGSPGRPHLTRDLETGVRPAPLRLSARQYDFHPARQRLLFRRQARCTRQQTLLWSDRRATARVRAKRPDTRSAGAARGAVDAHSAAQLPGWYKPRRQHRRSAPAAGVAVRLAHTQ